MNVELALASLEDAKANPDRLNMLAFWGGDSFIKTGPDHTVPPCGTTGCYGGFAALRAAPAGTRIVTTSQYGSRIVLDGQSVREAESTEGYAIKALDITGEQGAIVFYLENIEQVEQAVRYLADSPDAGYDTLAWVARGYDL